MALLLLLLLVQLPLQLLGENTSKAAASYEIIGLFPYPGRSHYIVFDALMTELAARGHRVTVYTTFPKTNHPPNYEQVDLSACFPLPDILTVDRMAHLGSNKWHFVGDTLFRFMPTVEQLATCTPLLRLWNATSAEGDDESDKAGHRYDLMVTETFNCDLWLLFADKLRLPVIAFHSSVAHPWMRDAVAAPDHAAYMPHPYFESVAPLAFTQRLENLVFGVYARFIYRLKSQRFWDVALPPILGPSLPSIGRLLDRVDMLFLYEHSAVNGASPTVPAVAYVAGLNVKPAAPVPQVCSPHLPFSAPRCAFYLRPRTARF
ncbi:hypothetical protein V9T40_009566 [Parthenolecanium corni]|uniref:Uncharacterized protein n=1 Tax=Parthenolecanium corni TaxID=536013 RepID=A0AAN9TSR5_9HEMI